MKISMILAVLATLLFSPPAQKKTSWAGAVSNGFKGDTITFDISADGKRLQNLTFKGYWRCSGRRLEELIIGPEKSYPIVNGKVDMAITEPEGGGATALRYDLKADIKGKSASGTLRINLNALGCDTYLLNWTANMK